MKTIPAHPDRVPSPSYHRRSHFRFWLLPMLIALPAAGLLAATANVDVGHMEFVPYEATIQAGDTVTWTWTTDHTSSVTSGPARRPDGLFDSGIQLRPFTFSYTFSTPGRYPYFCRVDPADMYGTILVLGSQPVNISTRLPVQTGEGAMIGGFIITGTASKKVIVLAKGPSLTARGVAGVLADPRLTLNGSGGVIATNENWQDSQKTDIEATHIAPSDPREAAIIATLPPGNYTALVSGGSDQPTGVGLVEVYDLDEGASSKLANISTRGVVETGSNVMIGGFILDKPGGAKVIVRALGPTLTSSGINNVLSDPTLDLRNANGDSLRTNNNWGDTQAAEIQATGIAPKNSLESAIVAFLAPGSYTAVVSGNGGATGVGLVEVYQLP